MSDTLRLGFVGTGRRGRSLVGRCYELGEQDYLTCDREDGYPHRLYHEYGESVPDWAEDVSDIDPEITAILDPSAEAREAAAKRCRSHGDDPALYESFDAFLAADGYDAVVVSSPNDTHVETVLPLLERDVDLFCEKPLATTLADHDRIIEAADRSDALLYVGFNLRSAPLYARIRELVREGAVGRLGMISCQEARGHFPKEYAYTQERSGGSILEKNCHDFDVFNWIVGADPTKVAAFGGQHVFTENTDVLDFASIVVEYDDGTVATLELCLYAPFGERTQLYELRGSDGLLRSPNDRETIDLFDREGRTRYDCTDAAGGGHGGADLRTVKRFVRCLDGEAEPAATPVEAKRAAAVSIAAERAVAENAVVGIDENYDLV